MMLSGISVAGAVPYCLSCHSASYMRYNRIATDSGLTGEQMKASMGFIADEKGKLKAGALMKVTIMVYPGEPAKLVRYQPGVYVLLFLVFAYLLKKNYWKDIH